MEKSEASLPPLPEGWSIEKTRFLYKLVDPEGKDVLFGLTEDACLKARMCLPEFGGTVGEPKDIQIVKL